MSKKIYVGNLNYRTTEDTLTGAFSQYGEVLSAVVIVDRATGQSKGFGFVEMAEDAAADEAIAAMNGTELDGRRVRVNVADDKPRNPRPRGEGGWQPRPRRDGGWNEGRNAGRYGGGDSDYRY